MSEELYYIDNLKFQILMRSNCNSHLSLYNKYEKCYKSNFRCISIKFNLVNYCNYMIEVHFHLCVNDVNVIYHLFK